MRKRHPLALPVDDQAGGDGLHAAGGEAGHDLLPQHRGDLVAVEAVEDAAGLLGLDEVHVDARAGSSTAARIACWVISWKTIRLHRDLGLELVEQVPGDGLALAVLVGGEEELVGVLEQALELGDVGLLVAGDHVVGLEAVVDVDAEAGPRLALDLGRDVGGAAAAGRGCARSRTRRRSRCPGSPRWSGLGRRLDDDQLVCHVRCLSSCLCDAGLAPGVLRRPREGASAEHGSASCRTSRAERCRALARGCRLEEPLDHQLADHREVASAGMGRVPVQQRARASRICPTVRSPSQAPTRPASTVSAWRARRIPRCWRSTIVLGVRRARPALRSPAGRRRAPASRRASSVRRRRPPRASPRPRGHRRRRAAARPRRATPPGAGPAAVRPARRRCSQPKPTASMPWSSNHDEPARRSGAA